MQRIVWVLVGTLVLLSCISCGVSTGVQDEVLARDADETIDITVQPKTLVLASAGTVVTVHTDLALSLCDTASLTLDGIPVDWTKSDNRGNLVAKFEMADVKDIVEPPSTALTFKGLKVDGTPFIGTATVTVK